MKGSTNQPGLGSLLLNIEQEAPTTVARPEVSAKNAARRSILEEQLRELSRHAHSQDEQVRSEQLATFLRFLSGAERRALADDLLRRTLYFEQDLLERFYREVEQLVSKFAADPELVNWFREQWLSAEASSTGAQLHKIKILKKGQSVGVPLASFAAGEMLELRALLILILLSEQLTFPKFCSSLKDSLRAIVSC